MTAKLDDHQDRRSLPIQREFVIRACSRNISSLTIESYEGGNSNDNDKENGKEHGNGMSSPTTTTTTTTNNYHRSANTTNNTTTTTNNSYCNSNSNSYNG
eukprot:jgi/Psemu1/56529/gm1.56529_g